MPKQYESIKASYVARGKDEDKAQRLAAMTFIANGKGGNRSSRAKSLHSDSSLSQFSGRAKSNSKFSEVTRG